MPKIGRLLTLFALIAVCACSSARRDEANACPLRVRLTGTVFEYSVLPEFQPRSLAAIDVPEENGFEIIPATKRVSHYWSGPSHTYPLEYGLPASAWRAVSRTINEYTFEIQPGEYKIVVRYRVRGKTGRCVAESVPFRILEPSLVVSTD